MDKLQITKHVYARAGWDCAMMPGTRTLSLCVRKATWWTLDKDKVKSGQMLSFNKSVTVGFRTGVNHYNDNLARSFMGSASIFAIPQEDENAKVDHLRKKWSHLMHSETRVRGMALTPERLYVAGRLYHSSLPIKNPESYDMGSGNFTLSVRFMIPKKRTAAQIWSPRCRPWKVRIPGSSSIFFKGQ